MASFVGSGGGLADLSVASDGPSCESVGVIDRVCLSRRLPSIYSVDARFRAESGIISSLFGRSIEGTAQSADKGRDSNSGEPERGVKAAVGC